MNSYSKNYDHTICMMLPNKMHKSHHHSYQYWSKSIKHTFFTPYEPEWHNLFPPTECEGSKPS